MPNVNKVFLIGHVTKDPELSYLPSQTAVVNFGLATNRKWKAPDGQTKEEVCFVDCQAFAKSAETLNKYVKKGDPLYIEGRLKLEQWKAQDGSARSRLRVIIEQFQFLSTKKHTDSQASQAEHEPETANAAAQGDDIPF